MNVVQATSVRLDRSTSSQRSTVIVSRSGFDTMPYLARFVKGFGDEILKLL
jgi:hypothetical protein